MLEWKKEAHMRLGNNRLPLDELDNTVKFSVLDVAPCIYMYAQASEDR